MDRSVPDTRSLGRMGDGVGGWTTVPVLPEQTSLVPEWTDTPYVPTPAPTSTLESTHSMFVKVLPHPDNHTHIHRPSLTRADTQTLIQTRHVHTYVTKGSGILLPTDSRDITGTITVWDYHCFGFYDHFVRIRRPGRGSHRKDLTSSDHRRYRLTSSFPPLTRRVTSSALPLQT